MRQTTAVPCKSNCSGCRPHGANVAGDIEQAEEYSTSLEASHKLRSAAAGELALEVEKGSHIIVGALGMFVYPILCALGAAAAFRGNATYQLGAAIVGLLGGMLVASALGNSRLKKRQSADTGLGNTAKH